MGPYSTSKRSQLSNGMPIYEFHGDTNARILITASIHGDEGNSTEVANRLLAHYKTNFPANSVTLIPKINDTGKRIYGKVDLNRSFPDETDLTKELNRLLETHDALIDLHTVDYGWVFSLIDGVKDKRLQEKTLLWASQCDIPVIQEMPEEEYVDQKLDRSFSGYMMIHHKRPAMVIELPNVGAREGIFDSICGNIVQLEKAFRNPTKPVNCHLQRRDLTTTKRGDIEWKVTDGQEVEKGDVLAVVSGAELRSKFSGIILARNEKTVDADDYYGMIAIPI